ncbi:SDR family oxidoreductase [Streptomyces sp. NPDC057245]|uniref:SDR family oxidoreductase n=1 Tax=Streptomyces TaxID=1883 RepID=UPI001C1E2CA6|nr:SDR family oxidoreductase [Streptomyces sp. A108]MBU6534267.1 SDR family oxidoreductase [Streptomyces sp. A108]
MELSFKDKTVVVTGAAGGFGSSIARTFAAAGAHLVVSDIDTDGAGKLAAALPSAIAVTTDVTDPDAVRDLVDAAELAYGGIDVMVNNAGVPHRKGALVDLDVGTVDWQLAVNIRSVFLGCKYAVPALRRRGGGVIVNIASVAAKRPRPGLTVYNATKGAVITMTRGLAGEVAPDIRVNAVNPVVSETGFVKSLTGSDVLPGDLRKDWVSGIPMARTASPQDVANSTLYLASDQAGFLTGVCLDVDGGRSIQ